MYVCICHGLKESDVHSARQAGAADSNAVFSSLGVQPQCGRCVEHIDGMFRPGACRANGETGCRAHKEH